MIYLAQSPGELDPWQAIGRLLGTMTAIWYVVWLALAVLGILSLIFWLFVPFALLGIKKRLDRIATALEKAGPGPHWEGFEQSEEDAVREVFGTHRGS